MWHKTNTEHLQSKYEMVVSENEDNTIMRFMRDRERKKNTTMKTKRKKKSSAHEWY